MILRENGEYKEHAQVELVILDGSNSWEFIANCSRQLDSLNQPYYIMKDNFAYVWERKIHGTNKFSHIKTILGLR